MYITDRKGKPVKVTDLSKAIAQAEMCVSAHRQTKKEKETNPDVYYFKEAHADWEHTLAQLQKLKQ